MRSAILPAIGCAAILAGAGCQSSESGMTGSEYNVAYSEAESARYWANRARIGEAWELTGKVLDAELDRSHRRVLRAAAQEGATVASLKPPKHTRVQTTATASAIYYNAFLRRFELIGPIDLYQGSLLTRYPAGERIYLLEDGYIRTPQELEPARPGGSTGDPEADTKSPSDPPR